jgi:hypothetical protein
MKQVSKRKRITKTAVGAAGLTFGLVGGAHASTTPTDDVPQKLNFAPTQAVTLGEEEIADVRLATFHLFDKENDRSALQEMAWGCRCGGCRACRGCGWRGCRCGGCAGCGGCCASWGRCRWC